MKKSNKWISLLWKSHKKELELKKEIERLYCDIFLKILKFLMNCIKEIDTDEYLEWQIRVMKD